MTEPAQLPSANDTDRQCINQDRTRRRRILKLKQRLKLLAWPFTAHANYNGGSLDIYHGNIPYASVQLRFGHHDHADHYLLVWYKRDRTKKPRSIRERIEAAKHPKPTHGLVNRYERSFPAMERTGLPDVEALGVTIRAELRPTPDQTPVSCKYVPQLKDRKLPEYPRILRTHVYGSGCWVERPKELNDIKYVDDALAYLTEKCEFTLTEAEECRKQVCKGHDYTQFRTKFFYHKNGSRQLWLQIRRVLRENRLRAQAIAVGG